MHRLIDGRQLPARRVDDTAWRPRSVGGCQTGIRFGNERRNLRHVAFNFTAELRARFGRFPGGVLGVLTAVERLIERLPVVALRHRILCALQRIGRGRVLAGGVPVCAGCACRVDRSLGLVHLLIGRFGTGDDEECCKDARGEPERHEQLSIAMKQLAKHDRPREKLQRFGVAALGDNELVAIILASGSRECGALELANRILERAGGLHALVRRAPDELCIRGVGAARAAQIVAAVELGRRTLIRTALERPQYQTPQQLAAYLLPQYGAASVEHFGLVMLDTKHRLIRVKVVAVGSLDSAVVYPREVFREATAASAAAIVLFHNHPSGDPTPSTDDLLLTQRMLRAGDIMGIDVIDHLILADQRYYSVAEAGKLAARVE